MKTRLLEAKSIRIDNKYVKGITINNHFVWPVRKSDGITFSWNNNFPSNNLYVDYDSFVRFTISFSEEFKRNQNRNWFRKVKDYISYSVSGDVKALKAEG